MIVAVDTGGTKTLITLFSNKGVAGEMIRFPTPPKKEDYIKLLRDTLVSNYGGQKIDAIVIAMPGIIEDGIAVWCNRLKWENFDVEKALRGVLGDAPIFVENDANLAGLGETRPRSPMPKSSLYVTVSTGIGTGIITNGHIDPGVHMSEGGRMELEYNGKTQEWENFASGRAIYETYGQFAKDIHDPKTWDEVADKISRGFLVAIPLLQPEVIIIGGSIGTYFSKYSKQLKSLLVKNLPDHIPCPPILQAKNPEEAVIYGCYYHAVDSLND